MNKKSRFAPLYVTLVLLLLYLPILVVIAYSFNDSKLFVWRGFTMDWYASLLRNSNILNALKNSLVLAALSCALAVILGTFGAVCLWRKSFRGRGLLENASMIPIIVPEIILGMTYFAFFNFLGIPLGMLTMTLAHAVFCVPYVFINVKTRLAELDGAIIEAAQDLGAGSVRTFFDITLPLILPSVFSGAMLSLAMSMDDVVISFFTTGAQTNTLPLQVYSMLKMGVTPEINALCTLMLGTVFLCVGLFRLTGARRRGKIS